jgi:hypothetical protein
MQGCANENLRPSVFDQCLSVRSLSEIDFTGLFRLDAGAAEAF